ncbi:hypothetical protein PLICRDRAFT_593148 [Plicaturopsis crispa FD-325 SS-3]|nr:hypothetical protein PLICRDRAFT_593148 [Plicaturopsis crispa FD-325 SS-3]
MSVSKSVSKLVQKSALNVVMGAMTFGESGKENAKVTDLKDIEAILDVFQAHGHDEVDTARYYCGGTSEEYLGKIDWRTRGLKLETKLYPDIAYRAVMPTAVISHSPEDLRKYLGVSLKALKTEDKPLEIWYLHGPDRSTPYEDTLKGVNDLYKEGHFKRFGLSNFMSWEVAEIVGICKANGYVQPTVYEGLYNAVQRNVEPELFPCLRKFGIAFYAFSPLGGGFFTGRYKAIDDAADGKSRFFAQGPTGQSSRNTYWNEPYFKAVASTRAVAEVHGLTLGEIALRWLSHHSLLKRELGDAVIIGASGLKHVEQNLADLEKGPLPEEVVKVLDEALLSVKPFAAKYFH